MSSALKLCRVTQRIVLYFICVTLSLFYSLNSVLAQKEPEKINVQVFTAQSETELSKAVEAIQEDLTQFQKENPDQKPEVVIVENEPSLKRGRILMAIVRGVLSFGAVSWTLHLMPDISLFKALSVGLLPGVFSGVIQYHMDWVQKYLANSNTFLEKCLKWLSIEVPFVTIISIVTQALGIVDKTLAQAIFSILETSLWGLGQGIPDILIADQKKSAPNIKHPKIKLLYEFKALMVAFISISGSTATYKGNSLGRIVLGVMGLIGAIKYIQLKWKQKERCGQALS